MKCTLLEIPGLIHIECKAFPDERGFFTERFRMDVLASSGWNKNFAGTFVQDNFSRSEPGVLRGLHYQFDRPQAKLVTCTRGRILDVVVDIRKNSPTFGKHTSVILDGEQPSWLGLPAGFAHGFCVLSEEPADVLYKVDEYYNSRGEGGILWSDPDLNINWPLAKPRVSAKDERLQTWKDYLENPIFC